MKTLWADFKKFISKGNVVDMAVGVIIGSAFSAIVNSLVNKILYPLLSLVGAGTTDGWVTVLREATFNEAGEELTAAVVIDWGAFVSAIINFLLIAVVLFTIVKVVAAARRSMDLKLQVQEKLDKGEELSRVEQRLLAKWQKKDPASAPKKKEAAPPPPPPAPPAPTETERLLAEILAELKENKKA